jgi:pSer/pThr/pTyr-binding forkhead associated (FHA) protein
MTWELSVSSGPEPGRRYVLGDCARIGRNRENEILLRYGDVSRVHAMVERHADEYWITDQQSRNGTVVNGVAIGEPVRLSPGDTVRISGTEFVFQRSSGVPPALDPTETVVLATLGPETMVWSKDLPEWRKASETSLIGVSTGTWELAVRSGPERGRRFTLGSQARIGRNPDNDISLGYGDVSRFHAIVERRDDGYWITDQQSRNGTVVNGISIAQPVRLSAGDRVRIAGTEFVFQAV